jgi:anti-anti-sigma factor
VRNGIGSQLTGYQDRRVGEVDLGLLADESTNRTEVRRFWLELSRFTGQVVLLQPRVWHESSVAIPSVASSETKRVRYNLGRRLRTQADWPYHRSRPWRIGGRAKGIDMESALTAEIEELQPGAAILSLSGEIDMATASVVASEFQNLADRGLTDVIVDARNVTFMDSSGLAAFTEGKRIIHERGSRILLVGSKPVRRILDLVFPEPLFEARFDSMGQAKAELLSNE